MTSTKLKVLAVMPGITPDAGAERSFVDMVPHLVDDGIDLHLALLTTRATLAPDVEAAGGTVHDLSAAGRAPARALELRRLIGRIHPAVVHATLYEAALPAQLAVWHAPPRMLVTWANTSYTAAHIASLGVAPAKLRVVQLSEIVLGRLASTRFHAVTAGVARVNGAQLRVRADRVFVGERGRDPQRFEVPPERVLRLTDQLGAPAWSRFVVAAGRQDVQKGYPTLLEQFDLLAASRPDVHLLIAGREGSATPGLLEQLPGLAHADRVHLLGQRDDVPDLMTLADVVVCTSWREGAAGALIEAMACRAPIVSVELDGLEDVLDDGHNALVVPRDALSEAIGRVLDEPDLATRLGTNGRAMFEERFTISRSALRLAEIYRAVAAT